MINLGSDISKLIYQNKYQNTARPGIYIILIVIVILFLTGCGCSAMLEKIRQTRKPLIFSVMGDIPRSNQEQISNLNRIDRSQFVFHVGDIKDGASPCEESVYAVVSKLLASISVPTFIVPGDNEWNDCIDPDPAEAWSYWVDYFMEFENHRELPFTVNRQTVQPENFSFVEDGILFIGINLVGGRVHNQEEWNRKQQNDVDWVEQQFTTNGVRVAVILTPANPDSSHDLFINRFIRAARTFNETILFIHGDGHYWIYDYPWLAPNIIRIQVDKGGIADPLQVTIAPERPVRFEFERYPFRNGN